MPKRFTPCAPQDTHFALQSESRDAAYLVRAILVSLADQVVCTWPPKGCADATDLLFTSELLLARHLLADFVCDGFGYLAVDNERETALVDCLGDGARETLCRIMTNVVSKGDVRGVNDAALQKKCKTIHEYKACVALLARAGFTFQGERWHPPATAENELLAQAVLTLLTSETSATESHPLTEMLTEVIGPDASGRYYVTQGSLGAGAMGQVFRCLQKGTSLHFAVKVVDVEACGELAPGAVRSAVREECSIMAKVQHDRLVRLHNVFRRGSKHFLVMELVGEGELLRHVKQRTKFSEFEGKYVFRQALEGLGYMHSVNVMHCDLSPRNLLVTTVVAAPALPGAGGLLHDVKIADFGLSVCLAGHRRRISRPVGTPYYTAPEPYLGCSGCGLAAADMWSLGAVLFFMVSSSPPCGEELGMDRRSLLAGNPFWPRASCWGSLSKLAKDLLQGMLVAHPQTRSTLRACARHAWLATPSLQLTWPKLEEWRRSQGG